MADDESVDESAKADTVDDGDEVDDEVEGFACPPPPPGGPIPIPYPNVSLSVMNLRPRRLR